jgi:glycosyltransferase involved in cell wall biosynthesis
MQNPLISICIPNYNYEKFIGETIESVLKQTYKNFELVIVDNGSTDASVKIIESYQDSRIRLYKNDSNIPVYENINKAQNLAKGELVAILHSDDKYEADFLENIVTAYNKHPDQKVFVTGVFLFHHEENKVIIQRPFESGGLKTKDEVLLNLLKVNNIGNGVNVVYHRDCLQTAGLFSDKYRYSADLDLWFRLSSHHDFIYIPKILTYYRIHNSNLSHTVNKNFEMIEEGQNIFKTYLENSNYSKKQKKGITFIAQSYFLYKYYCLGLRYDSGSFLRKLLIYLKNKAPFHNFNPIWYYTYLMSYLLNKKNKLVLLQNRIVFYIYKRFINRRFQELLKNELVKQNKNYNKKSIHSDKTMYENSPI